MDIKDFEGIFKFKLVIPALTFAAMLNCVVRIFTNSVAPA